MQYRVFNTGDQIWVSKRYGVDTTVKFITADGLVWEEGDDSFRRLGGFELRLHKFEVFCIKLLLRLLA